MMAVTNLFLRVSKANPQVANNSEINQQLLHQIVTRLGYQVLHSYFHSFTPQGVTGILVLSESHISIHTWPEEEYAVIEMVTCKKFSPEDYDQILTFIKETYPNSTITPIINT